MKLKDLRRGDVILCEAKLGYPLRTDLTGKGEKFRFQTHFKVGRNRSGDLQNFAAQLISFNESTGILSLETSPYTHGWGTITVYGDTVRCDIHKSGLKRVRRLLPYSIPGAQRTGPILGGSYGIAWAAYRTVEEVSLK